MDHIALFCMTAVNPSWGPRLAFPFVANSLHLAERLGAEILPAHGALAIDPLPGGGYRVDAVDPLAARRRHPALTAHNAVISAGVLGGSNGFSAEVMYWERCRRSPLSSARSCGQIRWKSSIRGRQTAPVCRHSGRNAPTYLPIANAAAREFARQIDGEPLNGLLEGLAGLSFTAHVLSGCYRGRSPAEGQLDAGHQVFGYPGLYVMDGSAISANVGAIPA